MAFLPPIRQKKGHEIGQDETAYMAAVVLRLSTKRKQHGPAPRRCAASPVTTLLWRGEPEKMREVRRLGPGG